MTDNIRNAPRSDGAAEPNSGFSQSWSHKDDSRLGLPRVLTYVPTSRCAAKVVSLPSAVSMRVLVSALHSDTTVSGIGCQSNGL